MSDCSQIYVACLAAYNSGHLHGKWIDADQDAESIRDEVAAMLRGSPCPNVTVDCPDCEGGALKSEDHVCTLCNGSGKVPSAEEWAIHDYQGFGGAKLSEQESFETVAALAAAVEEHGDIFGQWWNENGGDYDSVEEAVEGFQEKFRGSFDSLADYVEDFFEQTGEYKRDDRNWWSPINYVDWERMARDLEMSGDVTTIEHDGKVHVFDNL